MNIDAELAVKLAKAGVLEEVVELLRAAKAPGDAQKPVDPVQRPLPPLQQPRPQCPQPIPRTPFPGMPWWEVEYPRGVPFGLAPERPIDRRIREAKESRFKWTEEHHNTLAFCGGSSLIG